MAEPDIYLAVALSARALAVAARRSGRRVVVADLFGDTDTRASAEASLVVDGDFDDGFDAAALLAAAERLAPAASPPRCGLVYGSGLEARPELLAQLAVGRRLFGNAPATVARTKNPMAFFALLDRLGLPYPAISSAPPSDPAGWLLKRIGGSGGGHVEPAREGMGANGDRYFQRRIAGRPVGASFLADGRGALLLGFSEQWSAPDSYRFGGLLQPAAISPRTAAAIPVALEALTRELGLVGLNSLDLIVDGDDFDILEVNPRPGANLDVFDGADPAGLFGLHVAACEGRLPERWTPPSQATAMSVLYAERALRVPRRLSWPAWVADRPAPGARIEAGAPICTVLAAAPSRAAARAAIAARTAHVFSELNDVEESAMVAAAEETSDHVH
ncbi:MAG TPA: ATP-grasp domain-containing protein [Candidatus Angelobacter sp.]|nr:ATP-grasp domain-containing protein [Candidatus Angelobacter sp.]